MEAVIKLQRERGQLRRIFNRHTLLLEEALKKNCLPDDADMNYLDEKSKDLENLNRSIQSILLGASDYSEEKVNEEYDEAEKFKKRWILLKMQVEKKKPNKEAPPAPLHREPSTRPHHLKLPQLELRKFNDDPRSWVPFWSQFKKIHEDISVDEDEKYQYLCQAMAPNSKARTLVEGYAPTKGNYSNVVQMLKERFAKDEILIETYVREILKLVMSKSKVAVDVLYDKIVANLQTLETLGIVKEKYECILYPLVESALPDSTLLNWSRLPHTDKSRLTQLLDFLKTEVEARERLNLARIDFLQDDESAGREKTVPTATCLLAKDMKGKNPADVSKGKNQDFPCYFCDSMHSCSECTNAADLSLDDKKELIKKKGGCFICLRKGHLAKHCKMFIKCKNCSRRHMLILCPSLHTPLTPETENVLVNSSINTTTLLQTLIVKISSNGREKKVRALLDSGAQRSYIRAGLADEMMLEVTGSERLGHIVFGGIKKGMQVHRHIDFEVSSLDDTYRARMTALEQSTLCGNLPKVHDASIIRKLQEQGIRLTDAKESISEISLLIGSDYLGSILEPDLVQVENNLVAIKTKLGWTLQGPIQGIYNTLVTSHFAATIQENESLEFLWNIETLGIKDPYDTELEVKESEMLKSFNETVSVNEEGRYEVSLMWKLGHPELESNHDQAYKRLLSTTKKLEHTKKIEAYHEVFQNWIDEGIIEKVVDDRKNSGHYLPHHAVIKLESTTTKIRPVFDASAKDRNSNSLNACIEKGPNLIEVIPKLLILFRAEAYGVISDIKKAFLQISVCPQDRGNLKLLWWNDPCKKNEVTTYRHARVPFGVACSPFLLAATINHHLKKHEDKYPDTVKRLQESFYVDNCVTSFHSEEEKLKFIEEATKLMEIGKFELRRWKFSVPAAPWWGGWWERLVRVVKEMLRRILGKSVVNWIELSTILCDCEAVINSRPLTYVEMGELRPLTPMMFLHNLPTSDVPDLDEIDHSGLNIRYRYLQQLREEIRKRFKNEYLSLLINKGKERKREPAVGEVVLIETEASRLKWPIGIIIEIFTGKDGCTRAAKVRTSAGVKVRAYQRLYPLELSTSDDWVQQVSARKDPVIPNIPLPADDDSTDPLQVSIPSATRSGRAIKIPSRFLD